MYKRWGLATAAALLVVTSAADASTLFSDDFDAENGGASSLNYGGFAQFTVTGGTVDLIASGGFGITCVAGVCVDLDGSTNAAGRLTSDVFLLGAAQDVTLSFSLSGNQRGGASDTVTYGFVFNGSDIADSVTVAPSDPFSTITQTILNAQPGSYSVFFQNAGGDNVGAILDNVVVTGGNGGIDPSPIPLPASVPLLLAGLGSLHLLRRRKSDR